MNKEHFEVVLADDECSRRIHYQLRYQVFCLDTGYEDPDAFPDGEEKDEWDQNAVHFLVRERETQQWVAAMRLVIPQDKAPAHRGDFAQPAGCGGSLQPRLRHTPLVHLYDPRPRIGPGLRAAIATAAGGRAGMAPR